MQDTQSDVLPADGQLAKKRLSPGKRPPTATKREIIESRIDLWTNTLYAAQVQARVAKVIDNPERLQEAEQAAEQAIRAIDELNHMLAELS